MTSVEQSPPPAVERERPNARQRPSPPIPAAKTPQAFYAEITKRPDVRAIQEELAD